MLRKKLTLDVGGYLYETTRDTLLMKEGFFRNLCTHYDNDYVFIDRDGKHFRFILNHLRGSMIVPTNGLDLQELLFEADFYCLESLKDLIQYELSKKITPIEISLMQIAHTLRHN